MKFAGSKTSSAANLTRGKPLDKDSSKEEGLSLTDWCSGTCTECYGTHKGRGGIFLLEVAVLEGMEGVAVPVGPASSVCGGLSH